MSDNADTTPVQAELLLPHEIEAALAQHPIVYLPLGSLEYHSHHLPIGLDGLTAHGICARAATRTGGIVLPTLYYGVGGGHTLYPWTIMAHSPAPLTELIEQTLARLESFGVRTVVLFTGHFADEQIAMTEEIVARWTTQGSPLTALALSLNHARTRLAPDHAGVFETSLLAALLPDRVHLDQIPLPPDSPSPDPQDAPDYAHRHDPTHPLWGVMGPDPRTFDPLQAVAILEEVVTWTVTEVRKHQTVN